MGLTTAELQNCLVVEFDGKRMPQRVTAPYTAPVQSPGKYPSRAGHVKPGLNPGGPSPKAKYSLATDSEK